MNSYFAYIRVSTVKQGEQGSSLQEQRDAILGFAARDGLSISAWFEERETAAKVGRKEFSRMLSALRKGKAHGVVFHKIDRSVRNLKDWSAIQDLADAGIDVRFTQESINLRSNEGKLTGDFLAVISSHYIRNLREEVRKGIRGRLKQGLYPLAAPIGYLDQGRGKAKVFDSVRAPFIRTAFELYGYGGFSLRQLAHELHRRGLRSKNGNFVGVNRLAVVLRNPFYVGIIRIRRSGETFLGIHQPLISTDLFERVQKILDSKANAKITAYDFLFRRMLRCSRCGYSLIAERQKGHVYYRCHTRECMPHTLREEFVEQCIKRQLVRLAVTNEEAAELRDLISSVSRDSETIREEQAKSIGLQIVGLDRRLSRLTDAYIDGAVERPLFEEKKLSLLMDRRELEERREQTSSRRQDEAIRATKYLELFFSLRLSYENGNVSEKREILKTVTSNLAVEGKNVVVELRSPFRELAEAEAVPDCALHRDRPRTRVRQLFDVLVKHFAEQAKGAQVLGNDLPLAA